MRPKIRSKRHGVCKYFGLSIHVLMSRVDFFLGGRMMARL